MANIELDVFWFTFPRHVHHLHPNLIAYPPPTLLIAAHSHHLSVLFSQRVSCELIRYQVLRYCATVALRIVFLITRVRSNHHYVRRKCCKRQEASK